MYPGSYALKVALQGSIGQVRRPTSSAGQMTVFVVTAAGVVMTNAKHRARGAEPPR